MCLSRPLQTVSVGWWRTGAKFDVAEVNSALLYQTESRTVAGAAARVAHARLTAFIARDGTAQL